LPFHLHSNTILAEEHCSIRSTSSTELATYNLTNNILTAPDNKLFVGGPISDLTKPCDCVQCDILLEKLE